MPDTRGRIQISISDPLSNLFSALQQLAEGVKKATKLTKKQREEMRRALGETCELIDTILTTVKQRISDVEKEVRRNDDEASFHIYELGNMDIWENTYRQFHLCLPLRRAIEEIRMGILERFLKHFSFRDPAHLQETIEQFLKDERTAGVFVGKLLSDLSKLEKDVNTKREYAIDELEKARMAIQEYRDKFIDLERHVRKAIS
ncbi:MAG: hypothetical protein ACETVP_05970 [Candidatus Bathyarchaeia archaeon]